MKSGILVLILGYLVIAASALPAPSAFAAEAKWKEKDTSNVVLDQYNIPTAVVYDGQTYSTNKADTKHELAEIAPAAGAELVDENEELTGHKPRLVEVTDDLYFE